MKFFNPQPQIPAQVLATDLDGTFIPLPGNSQNREALKAFQLKHEAAAFPLVYATGRHLDSVIDAINTYELPQPEWIVCDVGSSIVRRGHRDYALYDAYREHLSGLVGDIQRGVIEERLSAITGLHLQQPDHQTEYKISYECVAEDLGRLLEQVERSIEELPYSVLGSIDPFDKRGLIDVLPISVSKAYALLWLSTHADYDPNAVIYSGDSGNDLAALASGFRAIIVGNASEDLAAKVKLLQAERNIVDRFYQAQGEATSGVLEGCRHYGLF
jgi:HAD superfamily hydrolase (TIGR01484 family)